MDDEAREPGVRVLLLEDSDLDAELILHQLAEGGLVVAPVRVQSRAEFLEALGRGGWGVILADYSLPAFDGAAAMALARERCPDVPFIFVSGAIGEEVAIETLRAGATDYVLKHRLERLAPAVRRALAEARERAERRRLEEELRRRAEELAEADRRKDEFLALLSHELRNPLAPVRNALQVMRHHGLPNAALTRAWVIMDRQVENMSRMVDDLLDVSRITRGKIHLQKERIDLTASAETAVETARPLIETKGHRVVADFVPEPLWVEADRVRLDQVAGNLVTNAAKYTDPGGRVEVRTRREGDEAVLSVRDDGIGLAPEDQAAVFDMFVQADRSPDRAQGGLGIGLTLARRLVELHGGTIRVASEGPGRGSEFTVRLPLAPAPRADAPADARRDPVPSSPVAMRVVVVDDNRDGAKSLAELLQLLGHQVHVAHDGVEAVEAAERLRPDLILMDVGMPRLNGLDATRRIRERPWGRGMTVIALTGWGQEADRERSREAGCDGHLVKPVEVRDLQRVLAEVAK